MPAACTKICATYCTHVFVQRVQQMSYQIQTPPLYKAQHFQINYF